MATSLQTTLAAEAHVAEGQFLLEEQTLNTEKSLIYRTGTRRIMGKIILSCVMLAGQQPQSVELGSKIAFGGQGNFAILEQFAL
jgi:predicted N-acetyltransferase YhbS